MPVEHVILGDAIWFWHHPGYSALAVGIVLLGCAALWCYDHRHPL